MSTFFDSSGPVKIELQGMILSLAIVRNVSQSVGIDGLREAGHFSVAV